MYIYINKHIYLNIIIIIILIIIKSFYSNEKETLAKK